MWFSVGFALLLFLFLKRGAGGGDLGRLFTCWIGRDDVTLALGEGGREGGKGCA